MAAADARPSDARGAHSGLLLPVEHGWKIDGLDVGAHSFGKTAGPMGHRGVRVLQSRTPRLWTKPPEPITSAPAPRKAALVVMHGVGEGFTDRGTTGMSACGVHPPRCRTADVVQRLREATEVVHRLRLHPATDFARGEVCGGDDERLRSREGDIQPVKEAAGRGILQRQHRRAMDKEQGGKAVRVHDGNNG